VENFVPPKRGQKTHVFGSLGGLIFLILKLRPPRKLIPTGTRRLAQKRWRYSQNVFYRAAQEITKKIKKHLTWYFTHMPGVPCWCTVAQGQYLKNPQRKFRKRAWSRSRDIHKFWRTPQRSSKTSRARDLKFGTQVHRGNISKTHKENPERGRGLGHVTSINFGVHPNVPPKGVELETWNLADRCTGQYLKNTQRKIQKWAVAYVTWPRILWRTP